MHIVTHRHIKEFWKVHPLSQDPLETWYKMVSKTDFGNLVELKRVFPSADLVRGKIVFNIGGNKYRLITAFHFNRHKVYVRHVMTHGEYDRGAWK